MGGAWGSDHLSFNYCFMSNALFGVCSERFPNGLGYRDMIDA